MTTMKFILLVSLFSMVLACSQPEGWKSKSMIERMKESKLLVRGVVGDRTETPKGLSQYKDVEYTFHVHCVLIKKDITMTIGDTLKIQAVEPTPACVSNANSMKKGAALFVQLRQNNNTLEFDNINVQGGVYEATTGVAYKVTQSCFIAEVKDDMTGSKCPEDIATESKCESSSVALRYAVKLLVFGIFLAFYVQKNM